MTNSASKAVEAFVSALRLRMLDAADPGRARDMQAYMKASQPFYGIHAGERRAILRQTLQAHPIDSQQDWEAAILRLWSGERREDMYQAVELAERFREYLNESSWPLVEGLVRTASHWDTLDWIAARLVGSIILRQRKFEAELVKWSHAENMWMRRASLLAHLKHKDQTNLDLLGETVLRLSSDEAFFIRKAIGWVLRELSKSNPEWVRGFIDAHGVGLSPLSLRQASKYLD